MSGAPRRRRAAPARRRTWIPVALSALVALVVVVALTGLAHARPGGGDTFSGGGGHGGGGGGSSGGSGDGGGWIVLIELVVRLIWLCVYYPAIGIPLTIGLAVVGIWAYRVKKGSLDWDSAAAEEQWKQEGPGVQLQRAVSLERVRKWDPDFSPILFEDFAYRLYATCHEARHDDAVLAGLAPYVADAARQQLAAREPRAPVTAVIVGAMRPIYVTYPSDPADPNGRLIIGLEFESNYTVQTAKGSRTYYAIERWKLARASAARTKPKDLTRGFPCPNCGAPWQADQTHDVQRCAYCGEVVDNGRFDWQIVDVQLVHSVTKPPTLTNDVPERGTNLPTYRQDGVDARWNQLIADDPALDDNALMARITMIYAELYAAWAKNDLSTSRPYVSDGLHDYLTYWILAYKQQGLRNCLEDMRITHSTLAKITRDRWYDAVTIRIWGTGKDYVIREADGHRVRGSKTRDRPYSEYWTVIRSAARRGPARAERVCGNCGAPAQVGMNGACEHCGAHVTNGEFDWVLSKIEQDDTYRG